MRILVNDLSVHGQFENLAAFRTAIANIMNIRTVARRYGRELHCHRNFADAAVTHTQTVHQAVRALPINEQRAFMQWLGRLGPFWDDEQTHGPDDYLTCSGEIVTGTAVGEAAFCWLVSMECHLVSVVPSNWTFSPVPVTWVGEADSSETINVPNHWEVDGIEGVLQVTTPPPDSWKQVEQIARQRCPSLLFAADAFAPLEGEAFAPGAAEQVLIRLDTLHRLRLAVDDQGERTAEGDHIHQTHFVGKKAWFTDSSTSEKNDFEADLTFPHPEPLGDWLFCPWHGKVKTPQLRIHFTWPVGPKEPLYVVYVGPKITKR